MKQEKFILNMVVDEKEILINKYKSPLAPPLVPASPFPASLILVPSSTPLGIVTDIFFVV